MSGRSYVKELLQPGEPVTFHYLAVRHLGLGLTDRRDHEQGEGARKIGMWQVLGWSVGPVRRSASGMEVAHR
jgi:hypothetical protein